MTLTDGLPLVDHHCHGLMLGALDAAGFDALLSEGGAPPAGATNWDTPLGLAVRRHCGPLLDLPPHVAPADYLSRRVELGPREVARKMLASTGTVLYLVDTGFRAEELAGPDELATLGAASARPVVRLEAVADVLVGGGVEPAEFRGALANALAAEISRTHAVATKSIAAYRTGFDLDPRRPSPTELAGAVQRCATGRVADPVLSRELLWAGAEQGLPVQLHVGLGDRDVRLHRGDPTLLTDLIAALPPVPLLLLHCWPYHRQAAYLAAVWPQVHLDLGLTTQFVGPSRAAAVLAETMELAPFGKLLYSSDAFGLAELYFLAASGFRTALGRVLQDRVDAGEWSAADGARIARWVAYENAERVYQLGGHAVGNLARVGRNGDGYAGGPA